MGHFYSRKGEPQHFCAAGGAPTTLREARKLGLCPSVTEVLQVISKPQLEAWKRNQSIMAALTLPRIDGETSEQLIARINSDAWKQVEDAAAEGVRIHDAIEDSFAGRTFAEDYRPHVEAVHAKLAELFPKVNDWVAEKSFAHQLGYGGKCDLHSPSTGIVADWKGKDGDFSDGKKLAWEQHQQLSAYQVGLGLPRGVGVNIFVSRTHPGKVMPHIWDESDMERGWRVFEAALALHKAIKNYDASWS